ncbi:MAG: hypothetical protein ACHQ4J_05090 [Candidatus Binatia bacterium]
MWCDVAGCLCLGIPTPTPLLDDQGRPILERTERRFVIVVETNDAAVGQTLQVAPATPPAVPPRPDLQIESTQNLTSGTSSTDISVIDCQQSSLPPSQWGGIPGINPPNFGPDVGPTPTITNALLDFACRFSIHSICIGAVDRCACTEDATGNGGQPVNGSTLVQFCDSVLDEDEFPYGDTLLTVQLRDSSSGNLGPTAQVVVRVATPTPAPP